MNLVLGEKYEVVVTKFVKSGVIVQLKDGSTELIHISNISDKFVADPSQFVSIGSGYIATCREGKFKPVELTLRDLHLKAHSQTPCKESSTSLQSNRYQSSNGSYHPNQREYAALSKSISSDSNSSDLDRMIEHARKSYEDKAKQLRNRSQNSRSGGYPSMKRRK